MRLHRLLAAVGLAAVAATAAPAAADPVCRVVKLGDGNDVSLTVCVTAGVGGSGTVRSATVEVTCALAPSFPHPELCDGIGAFIGPTGVGTGWMSRAPEIDPATASVRVHGTGGPVYVDGTVYFVTIPGFCVGDPAFCA